MNKRICLVTPEFEGIIIGGDIGSYYERLARLLSSNGWEVDVLLFPGDDSEMVRSSIDRYQKSGIRIYDAKKLSPSIAGTKKVWMENDPNIARSHAIHESLQALTEKNGRTYDLIEFPEWGGMGFVPINMKKNFKDYEASKLIVRLHDNTHWMNDANRKEFWDFNDMVQPYIEKYAFENADIQVSPTLYLLDWCRNDRWKVRPDACICRHPVLSPAIMGEAENEILKKRDIVFFGRFEERKGLPEFLRALSYIRSFDTGFSEKYSIVFIGHEGSLTRKYIDDRANGFNISYLALSHAEALEYLQKNARLVVIPSRVDNMPYNILDCMARKIPFITTRSGGINEILGMDGELYSDIGCEPDNARALGENILHYLQYDEPRLKKLLDMAYERSTTLSDPHTILQWYGQLPDPDRPTGPVFSSGKAAAGPGVTIIVPTHNTNTLKYLDKTLTSLVNQTYGNIKIIVNDGSSEDLAIETLERLKTKYPKIKFYHNKNNGQGNSLNRILPLVDTKYVMDVDADNIARPEMVETFVGCMENRDDVAALTCYHAAFYDRDEAAILNIVENGMDEFDHPYHYNPYGPCLPLLFFINCGGDANSIFLTSVLQSIGGWFEDKTCSIDWITWIKLLANGYDFDVIRNVLYYYRDRPESNLKKMYKFNEYNCIMELTKDLLLRRPEFFYDNCFEAIYRLSRYSIICRQDTPYEELKQIKAELKQIKSSTLYNVGEKLGSLSERSHMMKALIRFSGNRVKELLSVF